MRSQGLLRSVCGTYQQPTFSSHSSQTRSIGICPVFRACSHYRKIFPIVIGAILCMQQANFGHFSNTTYKRSRGVRHLFRGGNKILPGELQRRATVRKLLSTPPARELGGGGGQQRRKRRALSPSLQPAISLCLFWREKGRRRKEREQGGRPLLSDEKEEERSERKHSRFGSL